MAPMPSSPDCQIDLPANIIGRLIGKGGATIQELQRLTGCRVQVPRRDDRTQTAEEAKGSELVMHVTIRCTASQSPADAARKEGKCLRATQLLCSEGLSLDDALAQTEAELQAQKMVEDIQFKEMHTKSAVNRICISWSDFEESDIRAALLEACDDEDGAVDLLLGGYRTPKNQVHFQQQTVDSRWCRRLNSATPQPFEEGGGGGENAKAEMTPAPAAPAAASKSPTHKKKEQPKTAAPMEEFPCLLLNSSQEAIKPKSCTLIGRYAASAAASARNCTRKSAAESREQFPCLPQPQHLAVQKAPGRPALACPSNQFLPRFPRRR